MFKFVILVCLALSVTAEEKRDILGSGIGMVGNVLWTKDMQVTGCKQSGFCNTALCLQGTQGGQGIWGYMGNAIAAASGALTKGVIADETLKASCITAGMYDESLNGPQGYGGQNTQYRVVYQ